MSVNLSITLHKYSQQIDLTQKDWFPDRVFISTKFTHLIIHPVKNKKKRSKQKILININISNQVMGFVGWVGGGQEFLVNGTNTLTYGLNSFSFLK